MNFKRILRLSERNITKSNKPNTHLLLLRKSYEIASVLSVASNEHLKEYALCIERFNNWDKLHNKCCEQISLNIVSDNLPHLFSCFTYIFIDVECAGVRFHQLV